MLAAWLDEQAARRGEAPALIEGDSVVSYAALAARAKAIAAALPGITPGDRIACWLANRVDYLACVFAAARLGAVILNVNPRFGASEVAGMLSRGTPKALLIAPEAGHIEYRRILGEVPSAALGSIATVLVSGADDGTLLAGRPRLLLDTLPAAPTATPHRPWPADQGLAIFTTSGTTKAPKFVLHSHGSLLRHAEAVAPVFGYDKPGCRVLLPLSYAGIYGFAQSMAALAGGAPSVVMPAFDPKAAAALINRHGITAFNGTDDMFDRLLALSSEARPFPTLGACGYATFNAALDDLVDRADARGIPLYGLYGMSEIQALFLRVPETAPAARRKLPGGWPVTPAAAVRIADPESGVGLPQGQSGEIQVRGPSLMKEYWNDPEATAAAFTADGWFRTGDLGCLDSQGGVIFQTRMGDVLRLGGYLVAPSEIEDCLQAHPAIAAAQVVATPTSRGNRGVAFVLPQSGATVDEDEVRRFCAAKLAGFKVPARVVAVDAFPTTAGANGVKIQRARLRSMAADLLQ